MMNLILITIKFYFYYNSASLSIRAYKYFEDFELRDDGIAIVRINGPDKMNTISKG